MRMNVHVVLVLSTLFISNINCRIPPKKAKLIEEVRVDGKEYERVKTIHEKWYTQAVHSIIGAIGRDMYLKMGRFERRAFLNCLDTADDEHDLQSGAECVVHANDKTLHKLNRKRRRKKRHINKPSSLKKFVISKGLNKRVSSERLRKLKRKEKKKERKEKPYHRHHHHHIESKPKKKVKTKVNKDDVPKDSNASHGLRIGGTPEDRQDYQNWLNDVVVKTVNTAPSLMGSKDEKSPVKRITGLISTVVDRRPGWKLMSEKLKFLTEMNSSHKNQTKYGHKLRDIVTDYDPKYRKKVPFSKRFKNMMSMSDSMPNVLKGAFDLANTMEKHSDMMNAKVLSPRFMPLVDNLASKDTVHFLSPNILPFYKDDSPNSIMPLPDIIDSTGLKPDDRESVLDLVMEMSGAQDLVEDAFKIFKTNETATLLEDVDLVTNEIEKIFEILKGTFNNRQRRELAQQKFTFMDKKQLDMMYGPNGAFNNSLEGFSIDDYASYDNEKRKKILMNDIRRIGGDESKGTRRKKRGLTVLAPFVFGPGILSPAFLGPVVLSPNLFSPAIVSPTMLSPPTISPNIGGPLIISPYIFSPNVISPAIWEVYILSPYFIAPNVINPYLMSPIILSPHMLCPDVLSPTLLSGAILNPYFLSPAIFTESALAADVLSPSFMSKRKRKRK